MQLPISGKLNIGYLSRLFDDTSNCYKFFWFQAILRKLNRDNNRFSFDELVNEMIADAWYITPCVSCLLIFNFPTASLQLLRLSTFRSVHNSMLFLSHPIVPQCFPAHRCGILLLPCALMYSKSLHADVHRHFPPRS